MKKLYSFILVLAVLLPVLAGCHGSAPNTSPTDPPVVPQPSASTEASIPETTAPVQTNPSPETTAPTESIKQLTRDEAIDIALKDAGLTKDQVYDLEAELDRDNGVLHYDVDFEKDKKDYDYEIHAETGEILKKNVPAKTTSATTTPQNQQLTREEARDIALKHAGFTVDQVKYLETELDRDDGVLHYDVDFEKDGYDYDYEIDAKTGKILKSEKERD